jgi:hypothetical protein
MAERGAGKPVSQIELSVSTDRPLESLSTAELDARLRALGVTVDGECVALPAPDESEVQPQ